MRTWHTSSGSPVAWRRALKSAKPPTEGFFTVDELLPDWKEGKLLTAILANVLGNPLAFPKGSILHLWSVVLSRYLSENVVAQRPLCAVVEMSRCIIRLQHSADLEGALLWSISGVTDNMSKYQGPMLLAVMPRVPPFLFMYATAVELSISSLKCLGICAWSLTNDWIASNAAFNSR